MALMVSEHDSSSCASAAAEVTIAPREVSDPATGLRALVFDPPAVAPDETSLAATAAERGAPLAALVEAACARLGRSGGLWAGTAEEGEARRGDMRGQQRGASGAPRRSADRAGRTRLGRRAQRTLLLRVACGVARDRAAHPTQVVDRRLLLLANRAAHCGRVGILHALQGATRESSRVAQWGAHTRRR